tara:strand:- start:16585 stop:16929 length:345 start_codon:yes stop_codon:yes gene_type:complete
MDLIAITQIHRTVKPGKAGTKTTAGVKPEVEIVKAGKPLIAKDDAEGEELIRLKAARKPQTEEEKKACADLKKTAKKPAAKKAATSTTTKKAAASKDDDKGDGKDSGSGGDDLV